MAWPRSRSSFVAVLGFNPGSLTAEPMAYLSSWQRGREFGVTQLLWQLLSTDPSCGRFQSASKISVCPPVYCTVCSLSCWRRDCPTAHAPRFSFCAEGLNSILFAINIDNKDLNGQSKFAPTVSDLLKESTQNVTSLLKESTQGVSSLFREITASSAVSILIKPEQETDPLPVMSKHVSAGEAERVR